MADLDIRRRRRADRERQAAWRARKREGEIAAVVVEESSALAVGTEAAAVAEWSASVLRVPHGHPLSGAPMTVPEYGVAFYVSVFDSEIREALLCLARKKFQEWASRGAVVGLPGRARAANGF